MNLEIAHLKHYGHHLNPLIASRFAGVAGAEWDAMTPADELGQLLVLSWQQFFPSELNYYTRKHHGRAADANGETGDATHDTYKIARCGHPDFEAKGTGRGSWRAGCLPEADGGHAVKIHYDLSRAHPTVRAWWPEIQEMEHEAFAETGLWLIEVERQADAQVRVWFEDLGNSIIGLAELPGSGACARRVWCKLSPTYRPNANQVSQLNAHERGHNVNSGHISNDPIMHPTMLRAHWGGSFKATPFGARCDGYFGGEYFRGPQTDPPRPPTDFRILDGKVSIEVAGAKYDMKLEPAGGTTPPGGGFDFGGS